MAAELHLNPSQKPTILDTSFVLISTWKIAALMLMTTTEARVTYMKVDCQVSVLTYETDKCKIGQVRAWFKKSKIRPDDSGFNKSTYDKSKI